MQSFAHIVHQRTLSEHGDVPVRRSVQDCATRGKPHAVQMRWLSWAKPLCYEKFDASPSVSSVKIHMQSFAHIVHQRTLSEYGDVPVRRSVQDCATRGKPYAVQMRWLFVGEALVLRKARRIS